MKIKEALEELRKQKKRNFNQTIDLIINLKKIDPKKESINIILILRHKIKEKKVCAFLKEKSSLLPTITETDFQKYKEKKQLKQLVKNYDFFIASAPLMPKVATVFGKVLGPSGKMPSPQLGVLTQENEKEIKNALEKISKATKLRIKEASVKLAIAKENMKDEEIIENINSAYSAIVNALPKKKDNVKNVMIKFTMNKPIKVEVEQ